MDFVRKFGFWIGIGVVCLVALVLQFRVVKRMATDNAKLMEDLDRRRKKLNRYALKGNELRNERWITHADELAKTWEIRRQSCQQFFKDQPTIPYELRDSNNEPIRSMANWVAEFRRRCQALLKGLSDKGIACGDNTFRFQELAGEYKGRYPKSDEQRRVTHDFYVYEEFAKILSLEKLLVAAINDVKIGDDAKDFVAPFAEVQQEGLFTTYPYYLVIRVEFERILHVFRELLSSNRLSLSIERVLIDSIQTSGKEKSNFVKIQIGGRYMDFVRQDQKES